MSSRILVELDVTQSTVLNVIEQESGIFTVYKDEPGDLLVRLPVRPKPDAQMFNCDCGDTHGFTWRDVFYDELKDTFLAPSYEHLIKVLQDLRLDVI